MNKFTIIFLIVFIYKVYVIIDENYKASFGVICIQLIKRVYFCNFGDSAFLVWVPLMNKKELKISIGQKGNKRLEQR